MFYVISNTVSENDFSKRGVFAKCRTLEEVVTALGESPSLKEKP
jgi:hypothetical protein